MSKAQLKKALKGLDAEQMLEVLLEAYDTNAGVKDYFEYWLNPDPVKLYEKYSKLIEKEYWVNEKKMRKKFSASSINKLIKEFSAMVQDPVMTAKLMQCRLIHESNFIYNRWSRCSYRQPYERRVEEFILYVERHDLEARFEKSIEVFKKAEEDLFEYC